MDKINLKAYQNLENFKNLIVERWHYRMLNDILRNSMYKMAIESRIQAGYDQVLDIGTGTGILSIYAYRGGAKEVTACEKAEVMYDTAKKIFDHNQMDRVQLLSKLSTDINVQKDMPRGERVSLIVTEILDCGIFGEGILQTLIHAKEHLLNTTKGTIIPSHVQIFVSGFQSKTIAATNIVLNENFHEYLYLGDYKLIAKSNHIYDSEDINQISDFKLMTATEMALKIDFNDLRSMKMFLQGKSGPNIRLDCEKTGYIDGFVVWFELHLDENDDNIISTDPKYNSCWDQAIFKLNRRYAVTKSSTVLSLNISCKDGVLNLLHNCNSITQKYFEVDEKIIKFLNDSVYLERLENDIFNEIRKQELNVTNVLDFSPFPYVGLMMLKEKSIKTLYCAKDNEKFIKLLVAKNCINENAIKFMDSVNDALLLSDAIKFELVILSPFDTIGLLANELICSHESLKSKLSENGIIVPQKIEVYGELINSDWLIKSYKVNDPDVIELGINIYIDRYSTRNHLDLSNFQYNSLTSIFKVMDVGLNDSLYQSSLEVRLLENNQDKTFEVHGILYFYKIHFIQNYKPIDSYSLRNGYSHIKRCVFLADNDNLWTNKNRTVNIKCTQNNGIIRLNIDE